MTNYFASILFCFLTISLIGCSTNATEKVEPTSVSGITRVFMHEPGYFTFLVENTDSKKVSQLRVKTYRDDTVLMEDLEEGQPIRVEYSCGNNHRSEFYQCKSIPPNFSNWNVYAKKLTIHLHSVKEIDGAGWNHGKFGRGQTTVVQ